ncbi:hypothetical protein C8Q78DRAFT_497756 [Trametes maxima]|nr:hypothetical protein C8Q78DRAFT_497756 [Trametes maxima]
MDSCFKSLYDWFKKMAAEAHGTAWFSSGHLVRQLAKSDPCFSTLVTFLSDRFPHGDVNLTVLPPQPQPKSVQVDASSILDFIYLGMATVTHCFFPRFSHHPALTHTILAAPPPYVALVWSWKCHCALFLDIITYLWGMECHLRRHAEWSPMPWSRKSKDELSAMSTIPETIPFSTPIVTEDDLAPENDPELLYYQFVLGYPLDIPWKHAPHDGYPFCTTLSAYSATRRNGAYPNPVDHDALWLSTMTFGLLESFTRTRIPEALLLVPGETEGEWNISGLRILRFLLGRRCRYTSVDTQASEECLQRMGRHGREATELLIHALHAVDEELDRPHAARRHVPGAPVPENNDTMEATTAPCAVAFVLFSLCAFTPATIPGWENLKELIQSLLPTDGLVESQPYEFLDSVTVWCQQMMQASGWCPYTIKPMGTAPLFFPSRNLPLLSMVVRIRPPIRSTHREHNDCTPAACTMRSITDTESFESLHTRSSCTCRPIIPPLGDVVRLLVEGKVPVMFYDGTQLQVKPATEVQYVAISHVWSDGMGSVTERGLPACVVARVADLAKSLLPESGAFWIDSLCVPSVRDMRKQAIRLMAQTYHDAAKVLVIDQCIRTQCSVNDKSWFENLFYIASSEWSRRVWTLQEGFLARELWFEFVEGPVDVEERLRGREPEEEDGPEVGSNGESRRAATGQKLIFDGSIKLCVPEAHIRRCRVPLFEFREAYRGGSRSNPQANIPLGTIVALLNNRTTSRAEDELVAVSTLLPRQISINDILSVDGDGGDVAAARMKMFLLQLRDVPKEFAIYHGSRLTVPNFAWAPRSLSTAYMLLHVPWGTGECTEEGLLAEYYLAEFDTPVAIPRTRADVEVSPVVSVSYLGLTYRLNVSSMMQAYPALSINGLLLLDGEIPSKSLESVVCAGVRGAGAGGAVGAPSRLKSKPVVLDYGVPFELIRNIDNAHTKLPDLGRVEKSWVLLR